MLTVSFHKYGNYFFPGTGDIADIGERHGRCMLRITFLPALFRPSHCAGLLAFSILHAMHVNVAPIAPITDCLLGSLTVAKC